MALTRKEQTKLYDEKKKSAEKKDSGSTISYQDQTESKSKMGPISSTVEGSK